MSADTLTADGGPVTLNAPTVPGYGAFGLAGFAAMGGAPDELTVAWGSSSGLVATTYDLNGQVVNTLQLANNAAYMDPPSLATVAQGGVAIGYNISTGTSLSATRNDYLAIVQANGVNDAPVLSIGAADHSGWPQVTADLNGVHVSWIEEYNSYEQPHNMQDFTPGDTPIGSPAPYQPYADTTLDGYTFQIVDNQAQLLDGSAAVTLPGEPAGHAVFFPHTVGLGNGEAAITWMDSGAVYLAMYDAATHSISGRTELDWNTYDPQIHLVTLPDGGFAISWVNHGVYKGELFDANGNGGGVLTLTGQFGGIDSAGDIYTVGQSSSSQAVVQTYAINSSGGSSGGGDTGGGGTTGQTFTSDNNGDHWVGTSGDDTFNLGRGGDVVTGNGGNDTYKFAEIPWAGGHITDFNAGDVLDLTGLAISAGDSGDSDPYAHGVLKITGDSAGNAQVWAQYSPETRAPSGWWLVETLDGVAPGSLQHSGDLITVSPGGAVSTSDPNYVAPSNVTSITLTGSQQHIDASATHGVTITSNNTGNVLIGGSGDDVFHLGRGGDSATGGAGADTFAYAETPWAAGHITDFNGSEGDVIDVRGMLAASGYTGSDPFTDGYLRITDSASGAQIWSDVNQPGNTDWWLVGTIDGVSTSSLHYSGGLIT
jgi:hypothetical protein